MKKLVLITAMLALVLVVAAPAMAVDPRLDLNGDGTVTLDEVLRVADLDGDGAITEADLAIAQGQGGTGNDSAAETGNDSAAEIGNDSAAEIGNDSAAEIGNDSAAEIGNDSAVETGYDSAAEQYTAVDQYVADETGSDRLPPTGGATLLTLVAGVLLVGGGSLLVARRLFQ